MSCLKSNSQKSCSDNIKYNAEFDAYYDPEADEWLENKCSDPECYCFERPDKPSMVKND